MESGHIAECIRETPLICVHGLVRQVTELNDLKIKYEEESRKALLRISNLVIFLLVYLVLALLLSSAGLSPENNAAPDLISKLILLALIWFVVAPAFAVGAVIFRLRIEHVFRTKSFYEYMAPSEGSWANPDLSVLIGKRAEKALDLLVKILMVIILILFVSFPVWMAIGLISK